MRYLIGLDIGTSSVKGVLMTEDGKTERTESGAFVYTTLENGGVEIAPDSFVDVCFKTIRSLTQNIDGVVALCASSASGNLLVLDDENRPLTPIYNWQDTRVTTEAKEVLGDISADCLYEKNRLAYRL